MAAGHIRRLATTNPELRSWVVGFSILYVFAYLLVRPPAGAAVLTLPPDGALDLVTYARYAKHLLTFGTANVDLATFGYLHSPASAYLLAWHSLFYLGDPLDAAMPLLFMLAALFGAIAVELARSVFGLSWRAAMAVAAIAVCAPMFRWTLATYSLGELLSATSVLYLAGVVGRAASARRVVGSACSGIVAGGALLFFSAWSAAGSLGSIARGVVEVGRHFSPLALIGLPSGTPLAASAPDFIPLGGARRSAARAVGVGCRRVGSSSVASRSSGSATSAVDRGLAERSRRLCRSSCDHRECGRSGRQRSRAGPLARRMARAEPDRPHAVPGVHVESCRPAERTVNGACDVLHARPKGACHRARVSLDELPVREHVKAATDVHSELRM